MSMSQASETEKMQMKILSDKQSKNGDEQQEGMSVSDVPTEDFADPAILVIREIVKISYSKDELIKLREAPLSKKKPDFIDPSEVCPSIWDPEKWGFERKKSDTPIENGPRSSGDGPSEHRRRPGDPRERIRKENDGIVLSPQRRSFNSGCFVPVRGDTTRNNRSHSPLGPKNEASHMGIREIQSNTRRIGSGRILRDSWDFNDKLDSGDNEYSYRSQQRNNNNDRDDKFGDKYERRSFGRDFDITRDRENNNKDTRRINKGYERRRISDREQEEPEWFSGGPLSQNDTIELRGFDDDKPGRKKLSPSNLKRIKEVNKKIETLPPPKQPSNGEEIKEQETRKVPEQKKAAPAPPAGEKNEKTAKDEEKDNNKDDNDKTETESAVNAIADEHSFNFDEILKCETIPGLLTNGIGTDGDNTKSRFSRWFKQESPEKQESRRSSLHEDHHIIKHLLKDIGETNVTIPNDSDTYFAPISPAANTGGKKEFQPQSQPINIVEILQRSKPQTEPAKQSIAGKILSLDELEAKIRQNVEASTGISTKHHQKPDEDMAAAFKKLLEQAQSGGHPASSSASINKAQPMSLLEMLNHSQQQDEAARLSTTTSHHLGGSNINMGGIQHHHAPNDLTIKLQQAQFQQQQQQKQQMDMLNKLINATTSVHPQQLRASPLHDLVMQQSRDLLNRPEAQAILQGLKRGEITTQHLCQQLANPALQPRHREMLMTILKIHGNGGFGPSPRVLSPVPPHHMFQQQQQQQLRVSPLPPNAMHQRIPSPRELQVHTQNILQRALIKKKLEEQQENYRKKQEMQRGQSPSNNASQAPPKNVTSPTPLNFTPTSVLRKMTAEKEEGKESKVNVDTKVPPGRPLTGMRPQQPQWNPNAQYMSAKHPGRPIVKANSNFQTPMTDQFFGQQAPPPQQQQQVMQQQRAQQQQQQLAYQQQQQQQQQQRKVLNPQVMSSQYPTNQGVPQSQYNPQQYSTNQQFTQQQLRAQHQHRPANQQQSVPQQQITFQQQQNNQQHISGGNRQQFFSNSHSANRNSKTGVDTDGIRATSTSSNAATANQLARWFSPDLLERARGGELPSTAGLSQHVLSLEEIERQTAPPVHN